MQSAGERADTEFHVHLLFLFFLLLKLKFGLSNAFKVQGLFVICCSNVARNFKDFHISQLLLIIFPLLAQKHKQNFKDHFSFAAIIFVFDIKISKIEAPNSCGDSLLFTTFHRKHLEIKNFQLSKRLLVALPSI